MEVDRIIKTIQNDDEQNDDRLGDNFCIFFYSTIFFFFFQYRETFKRSIKTHLLTAGQSQEIHIFN